MRKILGSAAAAVTYFSLALPVYAQQSTDVGGKLCPQGSGFEKLCNLTFDKLGEIVGTIIVILLVAAAVISLFFLIWGGIKWVLSGGDKTAVEGARNTIIAAIIGLAITFLAFFILNLVLGFFGLSLTNIKLPRIIQ